MTKILALTAVTATLLHGAEAPAQDGELAKKLREAYVTAADLLVSQQDKVGAWQMGPPGKSMSSAAYTGLVLADLAGAPKDLRAKYQAVIDKASAFLVSKANKDGSFGEGPTGAFMKTYTTGIVLMALATEDREKHAGLIRGAQAYLKNNQMKEEGVFRGGNGYGDEKPRVVDGKVVTVQESTPNISVTGWAAEGLQASGLPQDDEYWKLVKEFVRRCQNSSETNTDKAFIAALKEKGLSIGDDGGLFYAPVADPGASKAGTRKIADKEVIMSYGAMTYDGIKTYLYAGLQKDSPEVKAAMDWVRKNYTVSSHPGFVFDAKQRHHLRGVYHYYLVMAKALVAYGENPLETFDGKKHDWPAELGEQLLKTFKESKWINENPAWYEGDSILVTSYVLGTLDIVLKHLK